MYRISEELAELGRRRMGDAPVEGFVYGQGPEKPELMLIGEAPGEFELVDGIPFIGRAGKELMKSLASIGLRREDVYITSAVRSRPYRWGTKKERDGTLTERKYNRAPTAKEILAHAPLLDAEMREVGPKLIVTLGNIGLQRLLGKGYKVSDVHGKLIEAPVQYLADPDDVTYSLTEDVRTIIPTFHPASVFYNPSLRAEVEEDWQTIGRALRRSTGPAG
ncbi:uracil-DNA glycosylase [Bhargavaea cecembensis]|uniref:Uracil-DNA glycosylase n=1 Tax=Bhargavaea cecembensis TaxID=394098 RepID=A0A163ERU9_9BACL|nr:uracil-DNA glycosylase [Bhargavaea cecembensis]KZE37047.1 uracil-DNA glycosylase [Bhargavaea cecembensis]